jgi:hypothetical protein
MVFYSFYYTIRDFIKLQLCVVGALRNHYFRLFHSIHFPCSISTADKRTDVWSRPSCIYSQIFSPKKKKMFFSLFGGKIFFEKNIIKKSIMQLFSADATVFSKRNSTFFLTPKKWKNGPQKLLIIRLNLFFHSTVQPTANSPELIF